jgi:predicted nucleotidyltransferase
LGDVRVFGSVARGEAIETSDVDLLVAPGPDTTLFDLSGFALDVEEIVGRHVDVATPRGLKARIRRNNRLGVRLDQWCVNAPTVGSEAATRTSTCMPLLPVTCRLKKREHPCRMSSEVRSSEPFLA